MPHGPQQEQGYGYQKGMYPPAYAQQPPQGYPPQGGFPPQQGGYRPPPESAHEHPLVYAEQIRGECKNCQRPIQGPGYRCDSCGLTLDMGCAEKIFYGNKRKDFHPHPLALRIRPSWICDICKRTFSNKCSFYCKSCDFDACDQCYLQF
jgi:hypothetical protein